MQNHVAGLGTSGQGNKTAITKGLAYIEQGTAKYEERYRQQQSRRLIRLLRELGIDPKLVTEALQTAKPQS